MQSSCLQFRPADPKHKELWDCGDVHEIMKFGGGEDDRKRAMKKGARFWGLEKGQSSKVKAESQRREEKSNHENTPVE
jgi:hypothetical protein